MPDVASQSSMRELAQKRRDFSPAAEAFADGALCQG